MTDCWLRRVLGPRVVGVAVLIVSSVAACETATDSEVTSPTTVPRLVGYVDGPVLVGPPPGEEVVLMGAQVVGTVTLDADSGCLLLEAEGFSYPVVWPNGTSWSSSDSTLRPPEGVTVTEGTRVEGQGGFVDTTHVADIAGEEVAGAAAACIGEEETVAFFNIGSAVQVRPASP